MGELKSVDQAIEDARTWVGDLGPAWVASFDQMAVDVRRWAEDLRVDPLSYEFRAAWCVATGCGPRRATDGRPAVLRE